MLYSNRGSVGGVTFGNGWMYNNPDLDEYVESDEVNIPILEEGEEE